jgi:patatin-like phospholipase/acyl hydrolase
MMRILSIDGGGTRGLIPAMVLAYLEQKSKRPVAELFDLVAGTSTGAIIAMGLVRPGPDGGPRWRAQDLVSFYENEGPTIYEHSWLRTAYTGNGMFRPKYSSRRLRAALRLHLGSSTLRESLVDVLVPTYDLAQRTPYIFKSTQARDGSAPDVPMATVVQAATAATTFFPPVPVAQPKGQPDLLLVDGGVCVVNPSMCAYAEARREHPDEQTLLVSLGCGELMSDLASRQLRRSGMIRWARPLVEMMMEGPEEIADYQCRQLLAPDSYFRFQAKLAPRCAPMDDATPHNQEVLRRYGDKLIREQHDSLDRLADLLQPEHRDHPAGKASAMSS